MDEPSGILLSPVALSKENAVGHISGHRHFKLVMLGDRASNRWTRHMSKMNIIEIDGWLIRSQRNYYKLTTGP